MQRLCSPFLEVSTFMIEKRRGDRNCIVSVSRERRGVSPSRERASARSVGLVLSA